MLAQQKIGNYVIVSPVKDEEKYIETTIQAILKQTLLPNTWIIVDDGSSDRTPEILSAYADRFDWIQILRIHRDAQRRPNAAEIQAFQLGFDLVRERSFEFVVKLDCDVDLPASYFERLLRKFCEDKKLGIASGVYLENNRNKWTPVKMPFYHAAGASKVVRRQCFEDIGGFLKHRVWDTADEVRARMLGWHTQHFQELRFHHLKREGSGVGFLKTNAMHGEIFYLTGGDIAFFVLKVIHRMFLGRPFLFGGLAMFWGYVKARASGKRVLLSDSEVQFYRKILRRRLFRILSQAKLWEVRTTAAGKS